MNFPETNVSNNAIEANDLVGAAREPPDATNNR